LTSFLLGQASTANIQLVEVGYIANVSHHLTPTI
jgi:hypothetical protein